MQKQTSTISNPLTVISVFASLAEITGAGILPFIGSSNQLIYLVFLVGFPAILVLLFFVTLNFNTSVLYAPSDFKNEDNYMHISLYNRSRLQSENIRVPQKTGIDFLEQENKRLRIELEEYLTKTQRHEVTEGPINGLQAARVKCYISYLDRAEILLKKLVEMNFETEIYHQVDAPSSSFEGNRSHAAIWLGTNLEVGAVRSIVQASIEIFPHLKFIHLSNDISSDSPSDIHDQVFIGGATKTAIDFGLKEFNNEDYQELLFLASKEEIHQFIRSKYRQHNI